MQKVAGAPTLHAISRTPDRLKRLLLGGRTVTIDGNTLDTTLQLALATQRISRRGGLILSEDVATARRRLNLTVSQFPRVKADVTVTDVTVPGPGGDIPAVHLRSTDDDGAPLLVYYHGGGFVVGGYETHGNLCEAICHGAGIHVLFVDYRLAPEHKAPAAVDDAYAAYLWARERAAELGADPGRVAVGGDSAGGNLAAVVAQRARDEGAPAPVLQLLLYPITNFAGQTRSMGLFPSGFFLRRWDMEFCHGKYLGNSGVDPADPRVSPLLAEDLSGLPPAFLDVGSAETFRDEVVAYASRIWQAGGIAELHVWPGGFHGFDGLAPQATLSKSARAAHLDWLRRLLAE